MAKDKLGEMAVKEAAANLAICEVLAPLSHGQRMRVMNAVVGLLKAEDVVPGVLDAFLLGIPDIWRARKDGR